jgi:hypothetical protein
VRSGGASGRWGIGVGANPYRTSGRLANERRLPSRHRTPCCACGLHAHSHIIKTRYKSQYTSGTNFAHRLLLSSALHKSSRVLSRSAPDPNRPRLRKEDRILDRSRFYSQGLQCKLGCAETLSILIQRSSVSSLIATTTGIAKAQPTTSTPRTSIQSTQHVPTHQSTN